MLGIKSWGGYSMKFECYICEESHEKGIVLIDKFICRTCELNIVETPQNELAYEFYKKKVKEIMTSVS